MLTGERRGVSTRRGMTVLGKIPAVPKPINLPSQRLENRGLDPNVEIVPRGSVSWGAAGRSPPTNSSPWGNSSQASSPPVGNGPWGSVPKPGPPPASSSGPWGANASRPSSAGSGTRPSSAGSIGQTQEALAAANAWGPATARPSSASGVLGQAQSQPPVPRPRSAETRTLSAQAPVLTRFADHPNGPPSPAAPAWGGAGTARKLSEDSHSLHQPARFTLTRVDFPTLGSEKNPDLRPQQNKSGGPPAERPGSADGKGPPEERPPPGPGGHYDEMPPTGPGGYGGQDRMQEGWRREAGPYGGHPGMGDGNWHREGPQPPMQQHGGGQHQPDTWRREAGHGAAPGGGPSDNNWRRGGPPVGPYGPPGPGRFQHDPSGFMHQQRYGPGPGPGPYGRGGGPGPGPGGFGRHGEMYGNAGPFARPGGAPPPRPGPPMGPGMYQGPGPYENYYGPPGVPGPGYGNMDEREMMMLGMGGGPPQMYNGFPQGPHEPFGRFPHGGTGPGPRHMQQNNSGMMRDRNEGMGYEGEGYRENSKYKESSNFKEGGGFKDGGFGKEGGFPKERPASAGEVRRVGHTMSSGSGSSGTGSEMPRPLSARGSSHHGGHRDWGAAASSDEPMDFSKPVFEEDVSSASPGLSKQSSSVSRAEIDISPTGDDMKFSEQAKRRDPSQDSGASEEKVKGWVASGEVKDGPVVRLPNAGTVSKTDSAQTWRQVEVESDGSSAKSRAMDNSNLETKDHVVRKAVPTEESEPADRRPIKEGSSSGPPSRERSMGREHVFSPHGGRGGVSKRDSSFSHTSVNATSAPRSSQHGFAVGGANNRSSLTNAPRAPNPQLTHEAVVVEEVVSPAVIEKHVSSPSSPSGSDSQRNSEKLRILKRMGDGPENPHKDIVNMIEIGHTEVSAAVPTEPKEDLKPKSKSVSSHDGEKEWRPKVPVADTAVEVNRPSLPATLKQSTPSSAVPAVGSAPATAADGSDKAGPESEISADSYDYEAQRARMKEIAAQRARQLRKEEEERIKEQKAKAMAKLEELNRRSSGTSISQPVGQPVAEEGSQEPPQMSVPQDEVETVSSEDVVQEGSVNESGAPGVSTPRGSIRSGRNEHGKRERVIDRKSNGRSREEHRVKIGFEEHRETPKTRLSVSLSQTKMEPPLLPSPSQQPSPSQGVVQPPPALVSNVQLPETQTAGPPEVSNAQVAQTQQQVPPKAQDARYRGKQFVSQPKQVGRQSQSAGDVEPAVNQDPIPAGDSTLKASGWTGGSPLDLDPKEVTLSLGAGHPSSEAGAAAFRKKKSKSSGRNKQKLELAMPLADPSSGEVNQGWNMSSSAANEPVNEAGKTTPQATSSVGGDEEPKVIPLTISVKEPICQDSKSDIAAVEQMKDTGIESGGSDVGSLRSNGDVPNKRSQRKPQPARRVVRDRGTSQDVRVADKPHGGEGMVWAPVRSPSGAHPNGPKGGFGGEGIVEAPVDRKDEPPVVQQTARARRAELERYTPKPVVKQQAQQQEEMQQQQAGPVLAPETSSVIVTDDVPPSSENLTEIKFGSEARQAESMSKHGRAHASWRQRGAGNERGNGPKETPQVQQVDSADTGAKFQQPSLSHQTQQTHQRTRGVPNTSSEQSRPMNSQHSRPAAALVSRQQTPPFPTEKEQPNPQMNQQGRAAHVSASQPPAGSFNREHKVPQESVTPYQPPRPGSSQPSRGVENEGHGSHEHVRSQRGNPLQMDRHNGTSGKFERDYHTPQERPAAHHQARHNSRHHGAPNSHDRDHMQVHSGVAHPQRPTQPNPGEGVPLSRDKDSVSVPAHGIGQGRSASQAVHGHHVAPILPDRERSPPKLANVQQAPRSPPRQRGRQQVVPHERDQSAPSPHPHHHSRYRQPGHEREHHREVTNAVHHQQQQRGPSDGHWQQTGVVADRVPPSEFGQSYQNPSRASHKSQSLTPSTEHEQGPLAHPVANQYSRSEASNKPHGPAPGDAHRHPHYQPVSQPPVQHQKPLQQGVQQGPKSENSQNSSHWNGERGGSPPPFRGRDHGHTRRGRFGGSRGSGTGARNAEIESRRDQSSKQRPAMDATGNAVPSQVGG